MLIAADEVCTGAEVLRPAWIEVSGTEISAVGAGAPPGRVDGDLGAVTVVPGFVDTHVHGGAGAGFSDASQTAAIVDLHRRHGTTTIVASLVSESPAELLRQVTELAGQVRCGLVAGVHLEGPWLSELRCGAHDPTLLRDPDPVELQRLLDAGGGTIRMITLAPERAGGLAAIRQVVSRGAVAAVGHTDADYAQTRAAIDAGATVATHLFNAMRPIHHREPGPVIALLEDRRVTVEVIADGVHVHGGLYRHLTRAAGPDRVALVTDAMAATGMPDGDYRIGPCAVEVCEGVAHLAGTGTIAGSTATFDRLFRFAVAHGDGDRDQALLSAVRQSSVNPARALGLPDPQLRAGARANLVVLDENLEVSNVLFGGQWVRVSGV